MRRRKTSGMTLIEIMIVVIIMALIATAVGVAVVPQLTVAKRRAAVTGTHSIAGPAELWLANEGNCPTVDDLVEGRLLNARGSHVDPWGTTYLIECETELVVVWSAGPDRQFGTDDDIPEPT